MPTHGRVGRRLPRGALRPVGGCAWRVLGDADAGADSADDDDDHSTGFDLLLQTLKLPAGSEVLCSAVTIPDMIYLLRHHGLVPVPVDLDPQTLAVDVCQLRAAVTEVTAYR